MIPANVFYCNGQVYSFAPAPGQPGVVPPPMAMQVGGGMVAQYGLPGAAAAAAAQPQNKGLVADLCKIIERQSQEIASLVHTRNEKEKEDDKEGKTDKKKKKEEEEEEEECETPAPPVPASDADDKPDDIVDAAIDKEGEGSEPQTEDETAPEAVDKPLEEGAGAKRVSTTFTCGIEALTAAAEDARPLKESSSLHTGTGTDPKKPGKRRRYNKGAGPGVETEGVRQCSACGTTETPKWRCNMTLCNACGLRSAKRAPPVFPSMGAGMPAGAIPAGAMLVRHNDNGVRPTFFMNGMNAPLQATELPHGALPPGTFIQAPHQPVPPSVHAPGSKPIGAMPGGMTAVNGALPVEGGGKGHAVTVSQAAAAALAAAAAVQHAAVTMTPTGPQPVPAAASLTRPDTPPTDSDSMTIHVGGVRPYDEAQAVAMAGAPLAAEPLVSLAPAAAPGAAPQMIQMMPQMQAMAPIYPGGQIMHGVQQPMIPSTQMVGQMPMQVPAGMMMVMPDGRMAAPMDAGGLVPVSGAMAATFDPSATKESSSKLPRGGGIPPPLAASRVTATAFSSMPMHPMGHQPMQMTHGMPQAQMIPQMMAPAGMPAMATMQQGQPMALPPGALPPGALQPGALQPGALPPGMTETPLMMHQPMAMDEAQGAVLQAGALQPAQITHLQ